MSSGFVTVGTYNTVFEADLVRGELEAFDLHASLVDSALVSINWLWSNMLGGVKVQVPECEAAEALRVLAMESNHDPDSLATP